jgi:hypothetical protein
VGVDPHSPGRAVKITGRTIPLLSFATVHRQLDRVPVGAFERFIAMHQRLYGVLTGRHIGETTARVTICALIHHFCFARFPTIDINAKHLLRVQILVDLEAWFAFSAGGD